MKMTPAACATGDAVCTRRVAQRRWLAAAAPAMVLLFTAALAARDTSVAARTAGAAKTATYLLPRAAWGFGEEKDATTSYVLPLHFGDAVNVTQRDTKGNVVWQDRFLVRKSANGWVYDGPVVKATCGTRNVRIVCDGELLWGVSTDPARPVRLEVPARRVRLGFLARETPQGTVEVQ